MMFKGSLWLDGKSISIALKRLHVLIGYLFTFNLVFRLVWGFIGNQYSRWSAFFPDRHYWADLKGYLKSHHNSKQYLGHNPLGKLSVTLMFLLLFALIATGLIRAGTDIYYPPFGGYILSQSIKPGVELDSVSVRTPELIDQDKRNKLFIYKIKSRMGKYHKWSSYGLMFMVFIHVFSVVREELAGRRIISAMFSGKKLLQAKQEPFDS